jgi:hypothetical protein
MTISKTTLEQLVADIAASAEVFANKITSWSAVASDTKYPSEKLIVDSLSTVIPDATTSVKGKVQLATYTETTTGTDTAKTLTPSGLSHSGYGKRLMQIKVLDDTTLLTTGDGKLIFGIPLELNGFNLVSVAAFVSTRSNSDAITVQVRNVTDSVDMLTTPIWIDVSTYTSYISTTPAVIDIAHDDVATGDLIAVDIDTAGAGSKGLGVMFAFQLP